MQRAKYHLRLIAVLHLGTANIACLFEKSSTTKEKERSNPPYPVEASSNASHQRGNRQHQKPAKHPPEAGQPTTHTSTRKRGKPPRGQPRWHPPVSVTRTPCHTYTLGCRFCNQRQLNIENRPQRLFPLVSLPLSKCSFPHPNHRLKEDSTGQYGRCFSPSRQILQSPRLAV